MSGGIDAAVRVLGWSVPLRDLLQGRSRPGCTGGLPGHLLGITGLDSMQDGRYILTNSKDQVRRKAEQPR